MSPLTLLNVQAIIVILGPLALGWWLRQRLAVSWRTWGWGALTFVASQLARLPFLYILTALLTPLVRVAADSPAVFWINLLVLSLTAGIFEETARWLDAPTICHRRPRLGQRDHVWCRPRRYRGDIARWRFHHFQYLPDPVWR